MRTKILLMTIIVISTLCLSIAFYGLAKGNFLYAIPLLISSLVLSFCGTFCFFLNDELILSESNLLLYKESYDKLNKEYTKLYTSYVYDLNAYRDIYKKTASDVVKKIVGYKMKMPENIEIFNDLINKRVKASAIGTIMSLVKELGQNDTLITIRVDHERSIFSLRVTGSAINGKQITSILKEVDKILPELAKNNKLIVYDEKITN